MQLDGFVDISAVLRCGVYALVKSGRVVYIGKSRAMLTRIYTHRSVMRSKNPPKWIPVKGVLFDEVLIRPCTREEVDQVEIDMIKLYKPRFNVQHNDSPGRSLGPVRLEINGIKLIVGGTPPPTPVFERRV